MWLVYIYTRTQKKTYQLNVCCERISSERWSRRGEMSTTRSSGRLLLMMGERRVSWLLFYDGWRRNREENMFIYLSILLLVYSNRGGATKGQTASNLCKDSLPSRRDIGRFESASQASCRPPDYFIFSLHPIFFYFDDSVSAIGWKGSIKESMCMYFST